MTTVRIVLAFAVAIALPVSTFAGDGAALRVLGFSPDGRSFAFEETGHHDGSNHPFFRVVVVGQRSGQLGGTIEPGSDANRDQEAAEARRDADLAEARARLGFATGAPAPQPLVESRAARAGEELLPMEIFGTMRAVATELDLSHTALRGRIVLSEQVPRTKDCEALTTDAVAVKIILERPGHRAVTLYDGPNDLRADGCPRRHGLVAVYLHEGQGAKALAVVYQSFPLGFEEPDRRFGAALLLLHD